MREWRDDGVFFLSLSIIIRPYEMNQRQKKKQEDLT
jgi:hypothetical protein